MRVVSRRLKISAMAYYVQISEYVTRVNGFGIRRCRGRWHYLLFSPSDLINIQNTRSGVKHLKTNVYRVNSLENIQESPRENVPDDWITLNTHGKTQANSFFLICC